MSNSSRDMTYTVSTSDNVFKEYFFVGADNGAVYVAKPLVGKNLTRAVATVRVSVPYLFKCS